MIPTRIVLVVAAAALVTVVALSSLASGASNKIGQDEIRRTANAFAGRNGESSPSSVKHVESTREKAVLEASGGDSVPDTEDVYLVVVHGHFVGTQAPRPPQAPPPTGSVLTIVVDAHTGQVTDWGISDREPDADKLGQVTDDG